MQVLGLGFCIRASHAEGFARFSRPQHTYCPLERYVGMCMYMSHSLSSLKGVYRGYIYIYTIYIYGY